MVQTCRNHNVGWHLVQQHPLDCWMGEPSFNIKRNQWESYIIRYHHLLVGFHGRKPQLIIKIINPTSGKNWENAIDIGLARQRCILQAAQRPFGAAAGATRAQQLHQAALVLERKLGSGDFQPPEAWDVHRMYHSTEYDGHATGSMLGLGDAQS